ncbi:MAG: AI-2E family transporter, partial [Acidobacteria bacterium]|nr:AI-2E family transporter [Acidobacteriota bacterium]
MAAQDSVYKEEAKQVAESAAVAAAEASWPQTRAILRIIFVVLAVAAILWLLYALEGVLLVVVLAIFFAYLISPLVEVVRRPFTLRKRERYMPRVLAIGIVYLVIFGSIGLTTYLLAPGIGNQITEFVRQSPTYLTTARGRTERLNRFYERFKLPPAAQRTINDTATRAFEAAGERVTEGLRSIVQLLAYLPYLVLIPILAFFLLKDADSFRHSALQMLPRGRLRWRGDEFFQDVNQTLAAYIRAQLIACLLIGTICIIGFYIIGVPYALVLGVLAGMLEFIPLVGPLTVAILAALVASFYSVGQAVTVVVFLLVLRIVHDYVVYPRIIGSGIHLHPLAVILAILCGEELAGLAGIFLAIPAVAIIAVTYRHWLEHRGSTGLVADFLNPVEQAVAAPASSDTESPSTPALP